MIGLFVQHSTNNSKRIATAFLEYNQTLIQKHLEQSFKYEDSLRTLSMGHICIELNVLMRPQSFKKNKIETKKANASLFCRRILQLTRHLIKTLHLHVIIKFNKKCK